MIVWTKDIPVIGIEHPDNYVRAYHVSGSAHVK